jgi:hypothetical protein
MLPQGVISHRIPGDTGPHRQKAWMKKYSSVMSWR